MGPRHVLLPVLILVGSLSGCVGTDRTPATEADTNDSNASQLHAGPSMEEPEAGSTVDQGTGNASAGDTADEASYPDQDASAADEDPPGADGGQASKSQDALKDGEAGDGSEPASADDETSENGTAVDEDGSLPTLDESDDSGESVLGLPTKDTQEPVDPVTLEDEGDLDVIG